MKKNPWHSVETHFLQKCKLRLGSYIHQAAIMTFRLRQVTKNTNEKTDINLEYTWTHKLLEINMTYGSNKFYNQRNYSVVGITFTMKRDFTKHILSYYFPSLIIVAISWISFTIPPEVIPARMALLVTLMLVLVNLFGTIISTQPPSMYPTSLVVWTIACIIFASGPIIAYAGILLMKRNFRYNRISSASDDLVIVESVDKVNRPQSEIKKDDDERENHLTTCDRNCLIGFPAAFLVFNVIYWPIVLSKRTLQLQDKS